VVLDRLRLSLPCNGNLKQHKRRRNRIAASTRGQRQQKLQRFSTPNENPEAIPHAEKHKIFPHDKNFKKRKRKQNHKIFLREAKGEREHRTAFLFYPSIPAAQPPCSLHLVLYS